MEARKDFDFEAAAQAMDRASAAGSLEEEQRNVFLVLKYKEEIQVALTNQALNRYAGPMPGHERLPLRDETGTDYGEIVARVPKTLYYGLLNQKNFGEAGFDAADGIKDLLKIHPQCRTKTVSGKTTVGWRAVQTPRRVTFGRGTLQLAT